MDKSGIKDQKENQPPGLSNRNISRIKVPYDIKAANGEMESNLAPNGSVSHVQSFYGGPRRNSSLESIPIPSASSALESGTKKEYGPVRLISLEEAKSQHRKLSSNSIESKTLKKQKSMKVLIKSFIGGKGDENIGLSNTLRPISMTFESNIPFYTSSTSSSRSNSSTSTSTSSKGFKKSVKTQDPPQNQWNLQAEILCLTKEIEVLKMEKRVQAAQDSMRNEDDDVRYLLSISLPLLILIFNEF